MWLPNSHFYEVTKLLLPNCQLPNCQIPNWSYQKSAVLKTANCASPKRPTSPSPTAAPRSTREMKFYQSADYATSVYWNIFFFLLSYVLQEWPCNLKYFVLQFPFLPSWNWFVRNLSQKTLTSSCSNSGQSLRNSEQIT